MKYIDLETGEIVSVLPSEGNKPRKHIVDKYVGIDLPFPDDCKDADTLLKCLRVIDPYIKPYTPVVVNTEYLLDSVAGKHCTMKAAHSVKELSKYCVGWNIGYVSKSLLLEVSGVTVKNFSRWVDEVRSLARIEHIHMDQYRLVFHPYVVWRGDENNQQSRINKWYKGV